MSKSKLEKFKEVTAFENTLELTDFQDDGARKPKGHWNSKVFNNDNPIVFELACGKGTYTLELARRNPQKNFIGIDIKGARIWKGAKQALEEDLDNVRFLRIYIDHLEEYFAPGEVTDTWITFPDPYPKKSDRSKRLTSPKFLCIYQRVLKPAANIHFKTDSKEFFEYSKQAVRQFGCTIHEVVEGVHNKRPKNDLLTIKTDYERRHLKTGKSIKYMKFGLH